MGTISYGLYLVHQNIGYVVMRELYARGAGTPVAIGGAAAVAFGLATALTFGVERPAGALAQGAWETRQGVSVLRTIDA